MVGPPYTPPPFLGQFTIFTMVQMNSKEMVSNPNYTGLLDPGMHKNKPFERKLNETVLSCRFRESAILSCCLVKNRKRDIGLG